MSKIQAIIWDLDNTLYKYDNNFHLACHHAAAEAAIKLGVKLGAEEAFLLADRSFRELGTSCEVFIKDYGVDRNKLHEAYHEELSVDFLQPHHTLIDELGKAPYTHAILTHGSKAWAMRILQQRGILQFFEQKNIVGIEQIGFKKKSQDKEVFQFMLNLLKVTADQVVMVEDSTANLRVPNQMGIKTILVTHGAKMEIPLWVDEVYNNPEEFLLKLNAAK